MASLHKRSKGWRAAIRRTGRPTLIKAFQTKQEVAVWGRHVESQFDKGIVEDIRAAKQISLGELFERYAAETRHIKNNASREKYSLKLLAKFFGSLRLASLNTKDIAEFRNSRIEDGRSASTINNNLHLLSAVIQKAMDEWNYYLPFNPVRKVAKLKVSNERDRRLAEGEEERLLTAALQRVDRQLYVLIVLALETAMRLGEFLAMDWKHISLASRTVLLPRAKNGETRGVPLSARAMELLTELGPTESGRLFSN